jgi:hypothetical protein
MPPDRQRRRELTDQYLQAPRPMGVYRITNTVNGRFFVGASVDLPASRNRHEFSRRMPRTPIPELLADWQVHGGQAFEFDVLDELPPREGVDDARARRAELDDLLELWLEKLQPYGSRGYNRAPNT